MDALLCSGKAVESFRPSHTDVTLFNDRSRRVGWEEKRINSTIEKKYQLHTGILDDEGAAKIDHLIYSPKVWIHDLDKGVVASCLVTDTSYTVKNFRNNRMVTYAVHVKESIKQMRK